MTDSYTLKEISPGAKNPPRISLFEYFFVFVLVIYAGRANNFVDYSSLKGNPVGFLIPVLLSGIVAIRWNVIFDKRLFLLTFCLILYFIAISIKYVDLQPSFLANYVPIFFIVYIIIKALKINVFFIFEKILYYLAISGLFFWCIQLLLRGDTFLSLLGRIPNIDLFSKVTGQGLNIIFYSVQPSESSILFNFNIPRNCGFAWEPGAFAVYLSLAIFINLFFIKPDAGSKRRFWVLLAALVSTMSTTGYIIFILIILYYLSNKTLSLIILLFPFALVSLIYLSSLPFMSKKVVELIDETKGINQLLEGTYGSETSATPQRFASFMLAFIDFRNNPILGVGGHKENTYTYKIGSNISTISGIGNLLAQFGLYGTLFFLIVTFKTSLFFSKYFNYKGKYLLFFVFIFISISYSVLLLPMVMCFWMFQFFAQINLNQLEVTEPAAQNETKMKIY